MRSPDEPNQSPEAKNQAESPEGSQACSPTRQRSPAERKMLRQIEKENSPVRAFLNASQRDSDEAFEITELGTSQVERGNDLRDFGSY